MIRLIASWRIPLGVAALLIGYRWVILGSVLVVAAASDAITGTARWVVLAPLLASVVMTGWLLVSLRRPLFAFIEIAAGVVLVAASGGPESPFVVYLTVPVVHVALLGGVSEVILSIVIAVGGLAVATSVAGGIGQFDYAIVSESMLLVAMAALLSLVNTRAKTGSAPAAATASLAADDHELLRQLATGQTYAQIAESLDLSVETIKVRVARLYRRVGANNRAEAIQRATINGQMGEESQQPKSSLRLENRD